MLALHQFCVVSARFFNLFFIARFPKSYEVEIEKTPNGAKKKTISRFICLTFACAFATALRPCLFLCLSLRNSVLLFLRQRNGHTCKSVCEFISDTSHHLLEEVIRWGGINFNETWSPGWQVKETFIIFKKRPTIDDYFASDSCGKSSSLLISSL